VHYAHIATPPRDERCVSVQPVAVVHYDIDSELHKRAKRAALDTDRTLKALIVDAITAEVERVERQDRGRRRG
jgi:predicted transcriptional regulator